MNIMREKEESIRKIIISVSTCAVTLLAGVTIVLVAGIFDMETWQRTLLSVIGAIVILGGIAIGAYMDMGAGTFECKHCGTRFVPTTKAYIFGVHTLTKRKLTCPKCGKRSYCNRRLTH